ncbi:MAG: DUF4916 domain-containing protein [Actinobacteria bacterium]|nr:DUF4916 domain-containing protein [Actinomycetota bacterium]
MSVEINNQPQWLSSQDLDNIREKLPILYVNVVPVRIDNTGKISHVGLLLTVSPDGTITRSIVGGRVLHGELVRDSISRHILKDLGPVAFPRIPVSLQPFDVIEYFPDKEVTGYQDPRQHAVALSYVVAVTGECQPSQDALDLVWLSVEEASNEKVRSEMYGGQDRVVRSALAHAGCLL